MATQALVTLTEADADRLMLLTRYVNSPIDGQHLLALERKISEAGICDSSDIPPDTITMNSRALVRFLDNDQTAEYTVVFPSRASASRNRISVLGSFGRALLGSRVGDVVEYQSGLGRRRFRVEEVLYQPEAAGDFSA